MGCHLGQQHHTIPRAPAVLLEDGMEPRCAFCDAQTGRATFLFNRFHRLTRNSGFRFMGSMQPCEMLRKEYLELLEINLSIPVTTLCFDEGNCALAPGLANGCLTYSSSFSFTLPK